MRRAVAALTAVVAALTACGDDQPDAAPAPSPSPVVAAPLASVAPVQAQSLLQHRFVIDGGPDYLALTDDAVWVKTDSGTLQRIDAATNRVTRTITVGAALCQGSGADADSVWTCTDDGVVRVDARTGAVVARVAVGRVAEQGSYPIAHGRLWVIGGDATTLSGIDVATNAVTTTVKLPSRCAQVAATGADVWVTCRNDDLLLRVDPAAGTVRDRISTLDSPSYVSGGTDAVYVAYRDGVARVEVETGQVTAAARASAEFGMVLATPGAVWVRSKESYLRRLDPVTLALVQDVQSPEKISGSVAVGFGSVWASGADDNAGTVQRLRL